MPNVDVIFIICRLGSFVTIFNDDAQCSRDMEVSRELTELSRYRAFLGVEKPVFSCRYSKI